VLHCARDAGRDIEFGTDRFARLPYLPIGLDPARLHHGSRTAHGPVLREQPRRYVARYRELSTPRLLLDAGGAEKTVIVFYISSYGNTKRMAEAIRDGISSAENLRVSLYDLEGAEIEPFVDLVEEADAILMGTPTINGDAVKPVWDLLSSFANIRVKGKVAGAFGSYGWTGEAVRMVDDRLRGLKMRVPIAGLRIKLIPSVDELAACHAFGLDFGNMVLGKPQERVIDMAEITPTTVSMSPFIKEAPWPKQK